MTNQDIEVEKVIEFSDKEEHHHPHHVEHHSDTDQSLFMGILAYLSVLIVISYLLAKDNPFVKFHIKQGAVLFGIEIILWVAMRLFWPLMFVIGILQIIIFILSIIGIVNVVQKKENELPLVGKFAKSIKL